MVNPQVVRPNKRPMLAMLDQNVSGESKDQGHFARSPGNNTLETISICLTLICHCLVMDANTCRIERNMHMPCFFVPVGIAAAQHRTVFDHFPFFQRLYSINSLMSQGETVCLEGRQETHANNPQILRNRLELDNMKETGTWTISKSYL